jgi:F-type H+-transporting ATPase subunit a
MSSLAAETIFHIADFPVTNALINAVIAAILLVAFSFLARPTFEAIVEALLGRIEAVTGDKKKARAFFPFVATIFLFLLTNNWLGLLPGTGTIGFWGVSHEHAGEVELIPLLRSAGADLNMTLALAVLSLVAVQLYGIYATGFFNYFSKFVNIRGIFRAIPKGPIAILTAIIEFFVGLIEIVSELAKAVSLSLRLFGNVFAGEVLIGVMMGLVAFIIPIPFMFLEILVGVIQATVFAMLVLVFLNMASMSHEHHEDEHSKEHDKENLPAHA